MTVASLRDWGADVDDGLRRCMNNEAFYTKLVESIIPDTKADELEAAVGSGDLDKGFEIAHAMKGMYANLSLTPILEPVKEITELLRSRTQTDYAPLLAEIKKQKAALNELP